MSMDKSNCFNNNSTIIRIGDITKSNSSIGVSPKFLGRSKNYF